MSHSQRFGQKEIQNFVYVDHRKDVAIVGTVPEAHGDEIIAMGRYYLDEKTNRAEVPSSSATPGRNITSAPSSSNTW